MSILSMIRQGAKTVGAIGDAIVPGNQSNWHPQAPQQPNVAPPLPVYNPGLSLIPTNGPQHAVEQIGFSGPRLAPQPQPAYPPRQQQMPSLPTNLNRVKGAVLTESVANQIGATPNFRRDLQGVGAEYLTPQEEFAAVPSLADLQQGAPITPAIPYHGTHSRGANSSVHIIDESANPQADFSPTRTLVHEGLHESYENLSPEEQRRVTELLRNNVNQADLPRLSGGARNYLFQGLTAPVNKVTGKPNLDRHIVQIGSTPKNANEAHSYASELPLFTRGNSPALDHYYDNYFNTSQSPDATAANIRSRLPIYLKGL